MLGLIVQNFLDFWFGLQPGAHLWIGLQISLKMFALYRPHLQVLQRLQRLVVLSTRHERHIVGGATRAHNHFALVHILVGGFADHQSPFGHDIQRGIGAAALHDQFTGFEFDHSPIFHNLFNNRHI